MTAGDFLFPLGHDAEGPDRREGGRRRNSRTAKPTPTNVASIDSGGLFNAPARREVDPSPTLDVVADRPADAPQPALAPAGSLLEAPLTARGDDGTVDTAEVRAPLDATSSNSVDFDGVGSAIADFHAEGDESAWLESMSPELIAHEMALGEERCDDNLWCDDGVWWDESLVPADDEFDPEGFREFETAAEYYEHRRQADEAKGLDEYGATEVVGPPRPDLSDGEEERWPAPRPKHDPNDPFRFIPKPLRDRAPTVVEVKYDLEPGAEWLGIPPEFWKLVEVHKLSGVELRCLLFLAFHWKNKARGTAFIVWTVLLSAALHVTPDYVGRVLRRLQDKELLNVWTVGTRRTMARSLGVFKTRVDPKSSGQAKSRVTKNKLQVDLEPLRRAVSGVMEPLRGSAIDLSPGKAWGFPGGKCSYFAMPFDLLLLISALELPGQAQLAFFWILSKIDKQGSMVVRADTAAMSEWGGFYSSRESRSALEVLCTTGGTPDETLVVAMRDPSSGRWAVDVAPAFEAIKPIPPLRPSVRRQPSGDGKRTT